MTNINIDRKIMKTRNRNGKKNNCIDISSKNINIDRKIMKTRKQKWEEKTPYRYFK